MRISKWNACSGGSRCFRPVFSRYDRPDVIFPGFTVLAPVHFVVSTRPGGVKFWANIIFVLPPPLKWV